MGSESRETILVVDDEQVMRELLVGCLEMIDLNGLGCADTREAETILRRDGGGLMLLDFMIPGEDGLTFAKRLREDPRYDGRLKIIGVSAGNDAHSQMGPYVDAFVAKPFDLSCLLNTVRDVFVNKGTHL